MNVPADITLFAIPVFVACMLLEAAMGARRGLQVFATRDTATSLAMGVGSLLIGLGLPDDGAHAPNERFRIEDYYRGMVTMACFLEEMAKE